MFHTSDANERAKVNASVAICCPKYHPKLDLVSYRGPRSMVTVNMSVDTRSTHGRYLGRCIHRVSVDCRSSNGRVSVEHRPLYRRRIDRSLDHLRSRDRPTVGRDSIGRVSAIYR